MRVKPIVLWNDYFFIFSTPTRTWCQPVKLSENETNWHHQFLTYIMYLSHVTLLIDVWMSWTEINFFKIKEKWYTAFVLMLMFPKFHAKLVGTSKAEQCRKGSHREMLVWKQGYCAYLQDNTTIMRAFSCMPPFFTCFGLRCKAGLELKMLQCYQTRKGWKTIQDTNYF